MMVRLFVSRVRLSMLTTACMLVSLALFSPVFTTTTAAKSATAEQLLQRLCTANGIDRKKIGTMTLKQSDTINAYTDGHNIVMYTKLWDLLGTDDRRAFVLGHELGHIRAGHGVKRGTVSTGLSILSRIVANTASSQLVGVGAELGAQMLTLKYTRSQEYQADDLGFQFFAKAGFRPEASMESFQIMKNASGGARQAEFLRSHPLEERRIQQLARKYGMQSIN